MSTGGYDPDPAYMMDSVDSSLESLRTLVQKITAKQHQRLPIPVPRGFRSCPEQARSNPTRSTISGSPCAGSITGSNTHLDHWTPPLQQQGSPATSALSSVSNGGFDKELSYDSQGHLQPTHAFDGRPLPCELPSFELETPSHGNRTHDQYGRYWDGSHTLASHPVSDLNCQQRILAPLSHPRGPPMTLSTTTKHLRQAESVDQASKRQCTTAFGGDIRHHNDTLGGTSWLASLSHKPHPAVGGRLDLLVESLLDFWLFRQMGRAKGKGKIPPVGSMLGSLCEVTGADANDITVYITHRFEELSQPVPDSSGASLLMEARQDQQDPTPYATKNSNGPDSSTDYVDADSAACKRGEVKCTTNTNGRKHTGGFECPLCGAHVKTLGEWRRHCKQRWPGFSRCTGCNNVHATSHINDHVKKVCRRTHPGASSYQITYDPHWRGSCDVCDKQYSGKRSVTTASLILHIWNDHMDICEQEVKPGEPPAVNDGQSGGDDADDADDDDGDYGDGDDDDIGDYNTGASYISLPWSDFLIDDHSTTRDRGGTDQEQQCINGHTAVAQGRRLRLLQSVASRVEEMYRGRTLERQTSDVRSTRPLSVGRGCDSDDADCGLDMFGIGAVVDGERAAESRLAGKNAEHRPPAPEMRVKRFGQEDIPPHERSASSSVLDTCCGTGHSDTEVPDSIPMEARGAHPTVKDENRSPSPDTDEGSRAGSTTTASRVAAPSRVGKAEVHDCETQITEPQPAASRSSTTDSDISSSTCSNDTGATSPCGENMCDHWAEGCTLQFSPLLGSQTPRPTSSSCDEMPAHFSLDDDGDDVLSRIVTTTKVKGRTSGSSKIESLPQPSRPLTLPFRPTGS